VDRRARLDEHVAAVQQQPEIFRAADIVALARASRAAYERIVPLLRQRGRRGFVRRIHGDLHLGNIALIAGKPVLFDAIEFSEIIASGDIFYDLAFLLMDLVERDLLPAANVVLNRYLAETRQIEDLDALAMLPFFLSMRAAIRAKVTAARMQRAKTVEQARIACAARAYFALALQAIRPAGAKLIAIGGLSGTGKTRLARALAPFTAPIPGAVILRSDVERKALFGLSETARLPADAYAAEVTARVYAMLADKARRVLQARHSAIVDAVFAQPRERAAIAEAGRSTNIRTQGLFLAADLKTRLARVGGRERDASDADKDVARAQERYDLGPLDWAVVDASGTIEETLARARTALGV
jgi:predicted kinase